MESVSHFSKVFRNRDFLMLWSSQIISQLGDRLSQMALIGLVYERAPGSALQIAKLLSFTILPVFLVGPIAGAYVDRWDRRRTMYACDGLRFLLMLSIPLFFIARGDYLLIYTVIFLAFSIGRFFVPAKLSILPQIVPKKDLLMANSLINTTGMIAAVLGFGISGVIVERLGSTGGFYLDSLSFLLSACFIFAITKITPRSVIHRDAGTDIVQVLRKSVLADIKEGVAYFVAHREIRFTAAILFLLWAALGSVYVVIIVFVQQHLQSATKDLGLLIMFLGTGLFAGSMAYGRFGQKVSHYKIIFLSLTASGIMLIVFALGVRQFQNFGLAAFLAFCLGMAVSPTMIAVNTVIHNVGESRMLGKVFSSMEIVIHLGFLIFMFFSSILAETVAPVYILVIAGFLVILTGWMNLLVLQKLPWLH